MPYYKYVTPERIDILENLKIRFTQPSALNDPFEAFPAVKTILERRQTKQFARHKLRAEMRAAGVKKRKGKVRDQMRAMRRDFIRFCDERWGEQAADELQRKARAICDYGGLLLCLSKVNNNILMWSHYAQSHQGFVIEFDATHPFFHLSTQEVVYSNDRPVWTVGREHYPAGMEHTKSLDWAYEQEVRKTEHLPSRVRQLPNGHDFLEVPVDAVPDPTSVHLFDIPANSITGVILGWKSTADLKTRLKHVLQQAQFTRVRMMQAIPSRTAFAMDIVKLR